MDAAADRAPAEGDAEPALVLSPDTQPDAVSPSPLSPLSPASPSSEGDEVTMRGAGLNGKWVAVKEIVKEGGIEPPAEFTEKGEVVGDPTMHPEVKIMSFAREDTSGTAAPVHPPLSREESSQRSGILFFKASATLFFSAKWKESFVNIDPKEGILFCRDSEAYSSGKIDRVLPFADIKSVSIDRPSDPSSSSALNSAVSLKGCVFNINLVPNSPSQGLFGSRVMLRAQSETEAEVWVSDLTNKLLLTARVYTVGINGEFPENAKGIRPGLAICFSGGGGRAHVCACGQLRALHHLGLLDNKSVDYISGVSAGAWATAIYTFYEEGARTDSELLGPLLTDKGLHRLSMKYLERSLSPIFQPAEQDIWKVATELVWKTNPHELWEAAMSRVFLKPFGLSHHLPFARREDVERIKVENPHLTHTRFNVTRSVSRPFWIAHGTIVGPQWARVHDLLPIQFTPIYSGSPYLHKMHYHDVKHPTQHRDLWVGGGMVDSFAFGGDEPEAVESQGHRPFFPAPKRKSIVQRLPKHLDLKVPAPLTEQSRAFGAAVQEVALRARGLRPSASSHSLERSPGDEDARAIEEAMVSMRLGPHMIQRVFKYAQDKLTELEKEFDEIQSATEQQLGVNEGVLERKVLLPHPSLHFSLRHALAISSDAPSVNMHNRQVFKRLNVQQRYWTPVAVQGSAGDERSVAMTRATTMDMGDGGSLDNTGMLGMLQRGVRKCIVFLNTVNQIPVPGTTFRRGSRVSLHTPSHKKAPTTPTSPTNKDDPERAQSSSRQHSSGGEDLAAEEPYTPVKSTFPGENPPDWKEWPDEDILPLFGQAVDEEALNYLGTHHEHNKVFNIYELRPLLTAFQTLFQEGKPLVHASKHTVLENAFWGIEGGWQVEILWCYLEDSHTFRSSLPKDVQAEIRKNDKGEFCRFPNFLTFGQQSGTLPQISLSRRQINLLSAYTEWMVMSNKEIFEKFMRDVPTVVRKRKDRQANSAYIELHHGGSRAGSTLGMLTGGGGAQ